VALFAGIARPADAALDVALQAFRALPDHAPVDDRLARELLQWAAGHPLACTAKDRVRLPRWLADTVWWRDRTAVLHGAPEAWFSL
jgi:tetraacyldisaccharide-1-P 4'-kinase